jgi:Tol biopolymer transport system component
MRYAVLNLAACILITGCAGTSAGSATPSTAPIKLDGTRWIAYGHCGQCGGSDDQIWLAHPDGTTAHSITQGLDWAYQADFSRDGSSLAFEGGTGDATAPSQIYVANGDGSSRHVVGVCIPPACQSHERPAWSPDGKRLAISVYLGPAGASPSGSNGIAILDLASGGLSTVTVHAVSPDASGLDRVGEDRSARWSPDGQSLVFWRTRLSADGSSPETAIFIVRTDGTALRELTPWSELAGDPDWSPDGSLIAYTTRPSKVFDGGESELVTIHPDGTGRRVVTNFGTTGPRADHPRWTPDGKAILYAQRAGILQNTTVHIWVIRADGSANRLVLSAQTIMGDPILQP